MQFPDARIVVFAKAPIEGKVKTRLIPIYGRRFAVELHRAMLRHTLTQLESAHLCPIELWCTPDTDHAFFQQCQNEFTLTLHKQTGSVLGERMDNAFYQTLQKSKSVVIIGSDCVSLSKDQLVQAITKLKQGKQVVISPASDGGYVLIGQSELNSNLFSGIDWGSAQVLRQTLANAKHSILDLELIETQWDVDVAEDVEKLNLLQEQLSLHQDLRRVLKKQFSIDANALPTVS